MNEWANNYSRRHLLTLLTISHPKNQYERHPGPVTEEDNIANLCIYNLTDRHISVTDRVATFIKYLKQVKIATLKDMTVPVDSNILVKEFDKLRKYKGIQIQRLEKITGHAIHCIVQFSIVLYSPGGGLAGDVGIFVTGTGVVVTLGVTVVVTLGVTVVEVIFGNTVNKKNRLKE